jgi:hypothetical protein
MATNKTLSNQLVTEQMELSETKKKLELYIKKYEPNLKVP